MNMAALSKMELMRTILKTMTAEELDDLEGEISSIRGRKFDRFLDLPPELRNQIYRLAIQPAEVKHHMKHGIAPAMLKVNHQIHAEVHRLYYSNAFMKVEYYNVESKSWILEKEAKLLQASIHSSSMSLVQHPASTSVQRQYERTWG